jgi:hypothetical protein
LNKLNSLLALAAVSSLLTACSQGNSAPPAVTTVPVGSPSYSKLQLAVGNATLPGGFGVNIVSTLRQPNGLSAVLLDTPSISGPWTLPAAAPAGGGPDAYATINDGGPSMADFASNALTGTPLTVHLGAPACDTAGVAPAGFSQCPAGVTPDTTTFGQSGGVFGMGLQPANSTTNTTATSYVPYGQPIFATAAMVAALTGPATGGATAIPGAPFTTFGGPPSFHDSTSNMGWRDGLHNLGSGVLGWDEGINVVQLPAASATGTYTMNVAIPTGQNSQGQSSFATVTASAHLGGTVLPAIPAAPVLALDGAGGGTVTATLPAGATEGYVQIVDWGPNGHAGASDGSGANCQGALGTAAFPVYYTIRIVPGTTTYTLPDTDGPNTTQNGPSALTPSPSICTAAQNAKAVATGTPGDTFTTQEFAVDYPLFEASYPNTTSQAPALTGTAGQADISISPNATSASP